MELTTQILVWLLVINLGIAFGAGLYESRIAIPEWLNYSADSGYFWPRVGADRMAGGLRAFSLL